MFQSVFQTDTKRDGKRVGHAPTRTLDTLADGGLKPRSMDHSDWRYVQDDDGHDGLTVHNFTRRRDWTGQGRRSPVEYI